MDPNGVAKNTYGADIVSYDPLTQNFVLPSIALYRALLVTIKWPIGLGKTWEDNTREE